MNNERFVRGARIEAKSDCQKQNLKKWRRPGERKANQQICPAFWKLPLATDIHAGKSSRKFSQPIG